MWRSGCRSAIRHTVFLLLASEIKRLKLTSPPAYDVTIVQRCTQGRNAIGRLCTHSLWVYERTADRDLALFYEMYVSSSPLSSEKMLFVMRFDVDNDVSTDWKCDRVRHEKGEKRRGREKRKTVRLFSDEIGQKTFRPPL